MIVAIDPGKHAYGVAWFENSRLVRARYVKANWLGVELAYHGDLTPFFGSLDKSDQCWIERQYLTRDHPRPQDIVDLAFAAGYAKGIARTAEIHEVLPIRWKGNVPKPIMTKRILDLLSQEEQARIERVGYRDHNTIDAIGIGLYALGRL